MCASYRMCISNNFIASHAAQHASDNVEYEMHVHCATRHLMNHRLQYNAERHSQSSACVNLIELRLLLAVSRRPTLAIVSCMCIGKMEKRGITRKGGHGLGCGKEANMGRPCCKVTLFLAYANMLAPVWARADRPFHVAFILFGGSGHILR